MRHRSIAIALALLLAGPLAWACNIPVFRYALERWQVDVFRATVFCDRPLTEQETVMLQPLVAADVAAKTARRRVQLNVVRVDQKMNPNDRELWQQTQSQGHTDLPFLQIQTATRHGPLQVASGALTRQSVRQAVQSPVREQLAKRLLAGDSIVWLLRPGSDAEQTKQVKQLLRDAGRRLARRIQLPEGIGLPGSELYSDIPLVVRFSVLEVSPTDPNEQYLQSMFTAAEQAPGGEEEESTALVMPVFGRGRALEVIPADTLTPELVADITDFLCAACSCQVKEQNPGFDLLLDVNWRDALFPDDQQPPEPADRRSGSQPQPPRLLQLPPGRTPRQ